MRNATAAEDLGQLRRVPRTRIRIWYRRMRLAPLSRREGNTRGRSDARSGRRLMG
jgi:hypothetical protein